MTSAEHSSATSVDAGYALLIAGAAALAPDLCSAFIAIDPGRLAAIEARLETAYVEMAPGDLLLLHPSTLHRSDQNRSDAPHWAMICCYEAASNGPYEPSHHTACKRLERIADDAIPSFGGRTFDGGEREALVRSDEDPSVEAVRV